MIARAQMIAAALGIGVTQVVAGSALQPGAYTVKIELQLPHLDNAGATKQETICVTGDGSRGLRVLSGNNPLSLCPVSNLREAEGRLTFDIVCPGGNAARAAAAYRLHDSAFEGRIAMNMGGKNMTMTEVQNGIRTGDCPATR